MQIDKIIAGKLPDEINVVIEIPMNGRPRKMDVTTLRMAMNAMEDNKSVAMEVARRLGITTTTLYAYINGDGSLKEAGTKLLNQINKNITKLSENSPSKQSGSSSLLP